MNSRPDEILAGEGGREEVRDLRVAVNQVSNQPSQRRLPGFRGQAGELSVFLEVRALRVAEGARQIGHPK